VVQAAYARRAAISPSRCDRRLRATAPSSRDVLRPVRRAMRDSRCDIVLDLTGGAALFPPEPAGDGYLRADPATRRRCCARPAGARSGRSVRQTALQSRSPTRCARIPLAHRRLPACLDLVPRRDRAGGDHVAIDPGLCAAAASAPPRVRPAPRPTPCRRSMRCLRKLRALLPDLSRRGATPRSCCCMTPRTARR